MYNIKEIVKKKDRLVEGHRMCAGCGAPVVVRNCLRALKDEDKAIISCATCCLEVSTCIYPYTSWDNASFIHTAFACSSATATGVIHARDVLKKKEKIQGDIKVIVIGGDGGTYDIGLQSLSGSMERGEDLTYICYDNGAYMNTGTQRSSATPHFADTTTTPAGKNSYGKVQVRKDMCEIMASHGIPYVCQTALFGNLKDLYEKSEKAIYTKGATYVSVLSPCTRGWGYLPEKLKEISELAVNSCFFPVYEIENGVYRVTYKPANKIPVEEFLKTQKRFKHLFKDENKHLIQQIQEEVDKKWNDLLEKEANTNKINNNEINNNNGESIK